MEVLTLLISVSLLLAGGGIGFYIWMTKQHTYEHSDRMALLPLEESESPLEDD